MNASLGSVGEENGPSLYRRRRLGFKYSRGPSLPFCRLFHMSISEGRGYRFDDTDALAALIPALLRL